MIDRTDNNSGIIQLNKLIKLLIVIYVYYVSCINNEKNY